MIHEYRKFGWGLCLALWLGLGAWAPVQAAPDPLSDGMEIRTTDVPAERLLAGPEAPGAAEVEERLVRELVHMIHESIENEEPDLKGLRGFVKNWVNNLNFRQVGINVYRYYHSEGQRGPLKHLVPDILTMLAASHTIESTSSLWGTSLAASLGAPDFVLWGLGVVGGVITVPGLDPLCIGLMFTYGVSKRFRRVVAVGRVALFKTGHFLGTHLGVIPLMRWMSQSEDRLAYILRKLEGRPGRFTVRFEPAEEGLYRFRFRDPSGKRELLELTVRRTEQNKLILESVRYDARDPRELKALVRDNSLRSFGWNVRNLLGHVADWESKGKHELFRDRFYVDALHEQGGYREIRLKPGAVDLPARGRLRIFGSPPTGPPTDCPRLFASLAP